MESYWSVVYSGFCASSSMKQCFLCSLLVFCCHIKRMMRTEGWWCHDSLLYLWTDYSKNVVPMIKQWLVIPILSWVTWRIIVRGKMLLAAFCHVMWTNANKTLSCPQPVIGYVGQLQGCTSCMSRVWTDGWWNGGLSDWQVGMSDLGLHQNNGT